jgi:hypothetical protein
VIASLILDATTRISKSDALILSPIIVYCKLGILKPDGLYSVTMLCFSYRLEIFLPTQYQKCIQMRLGKRNQYCHKALLVSLGIVGRILFEYLELKLRLVVKSAAEV